MTYATYLGGSAKDEAHGIAVDAGGNAYVAGIARSSNFPTRNAAAPGIERRERRVSSPSSIPPAPRSSIRRSSAARATSAASASRSTRAGRRPSWDGPTSSDFPVTPGVFQPLHRLRRSRRQQRIRHQAQCAGDGARLVVVPRRRLVRRLGRVVVLRHLRRGRRHRCRDSRSPSTPPDSLMSAATRRPRCFRCVDPLQDFGPGSDVQRAPFVARIRPGGAPLAYSVVAGSAHSRRRASTRSLSTAAAAWSPSAARPAIFPLTARRDARRRATRSCSSSPTGIYPTTLRSSANPAAARSPLC